MRYRAQVLIARRVRTGIQVCALVMAGVCSSPDRLQAPESPSKEAVVPAGGLIAEWRLDETGSPAVAADTKNDFDGQVFGGAASIASPLARALVLNNGSAGIGGKYVEMPNNNDSLNNVQEGSYSLSAWFYPLSVPGDDSIQNRAWSIITKAGLNLGLVYTKDQRFQMRHYLVGDTLKAIESSSTHPINAWYHVVGTVDKPNGEVRVYVNGASAGMVSFTDNRNAREYGTKEWRIGKAQTSWAADGRADQVRIYNRELTSTEVSDLFAETVPSGLRPAREPTQPA